MVSTKLCISVRARLAKKYAAADLARIDAVLKQWITADKVRGFRTLLVYVDEPASMKPFGVAAMAGAPTAAKIKPILDRLIAKVMPDYVVLLGSDDIVPHFRVPNPTHTSNEDTDRDVPTDNPYACSTTFNRAKRASYLVPDRVLGRIPDLPGSGDPAWFVDYLTHAKQWVSAPAAKYGGKGLSVSCAVWRAAGIACVKELGGAVTDLLVSAPITEGDAPLRSRHKHLRHLIKCHGVELDARFYGEGPSSSFPVTLSAQSLKGRVSPGTVVGAMCCYGAGLFDPASPLALQPGEPPIPLVYLKQGAHGFMGSTTLAWVGDTGMLCADWVATAFLKHATSGASLGRAALEAKQDLLRWLQQEGQKPDRADEKTMLQFLLLGDPSIHPVLPVPVSGGPKLASMKPVAATARAVLAGTSQRRGRRLLRTQLGSVLRQGLPRRHALDNRQAPAAVRAAARAAFGRIARSTATAMSATPTMRERLTRQGEVASLAAPVSAKPGLKLAARVSVADASTFQYCWIVRLKGEGLRRVGMVTVEADAEGRVTFERAVVSS